MPIIQSKNLSKQTTRRSALKGLGLGALALNSLGLLTPSANAQSGAGQDAAVLNFALNLEYLEAEFYSYAVTGKSIEENNADINGSGDLGDVTVKEDAKVHFETPAIEQFAQELAQDEIAHVNFLRGALKAAGVQPVSRPAIDLKNSFTAAARAAGIIGEGDTFDPFANELNFLLASFIFEDVGVTAYKGGSRLITNKDYLEAAAGILAVEAYHAGVIRLFVYQKGEAAREIAQKISDLRDAVDGEDDRDQGVVMDHKINLVPTDNNGIAFSRNTRQVLNIVYLGADAEKGGFYPNGLNGAIR